MRRRENLRRDKLLRNENVIEEKNEVMIQKIILQYEENDDDGVIPNEQRRKFGEEGDIFYECEHYNDLKMKKIQSL